MPVEANRLASKSARDFIRRMTDQVSMPEVHLEVRRLIQNQQSILTDFSRIIGPDSVLSIPLIGIDNSRYFGSSRHAIRVYRSIGLM